MARAPGQRGADPAAGHAVDPHAAEARLQGAGGGGPTVSWLCAWVSIATDLFRAVVPNLVGRDSPQGRLIDIFHVVIILSLGYKRCYKRHVYKQCDAMPWYVHSDNVTSLEI